jgi:hypothetical protein
MVLPSVVIPFPIVLKHNSELEKVVEKEVRRQSEDCRPHPRSSVANPFLPFVVGPGVGQFFADTTNGYAPSCPCAPVSCIVVRFSPLTERRGTY